jgi:hypothetical protein
MLSVLSLSLQERRKNLLNPEIEKEIYGKLLLLGTHI